MIMLIFKNLIFLKIIENKSGIYRWINIETGEKYIGSAVNLSRRLAEYYSLSQLLKSNMRIKRALLKYGYSKFSLEILEYCDNPSSVLKKEQHYIDLLQPEYNILKIAGSSLGYKHTEDTLAKFKSRKLTPEHIAKLKEHLKSHNSSVEQREKSRKRIYDYNKLKGILVEVFDTLNSKTTVYSSMREAADAIGCVHRTIILADKRFKTTGINKPIKKRYIVKIILNGRWLLFGWYYKTLYW